MALLNYTSTVPIEKTVNEIHRTLVGNGARSIVTHYNDNGQPIGIGFLAKTPLGDQGFTLPVRIDAVYEVLKRQQRQGKIPPRFVSREQAARVAWRITKDWVEAQMAILESEMVTLDQIFLPYLNVSPELTMYDAFKLRQLPAPSVRPAAE